MMIRDNRSLVTRIVNLRLETAKMLGFRNYAEMVLGDRMAEDPAKVNSFLEDLSNASHQQHCAILKMLKILL